MTYLWIQLDTPQFHTVINPAKLYVAGLVHIHYSISNRKCCITYTVMYSKCILLHNINNMSIVFHNSNAQWGYFITKHLLYDYIE